MSSGDPLTQLTVTILGAGTIGASWAALFLSHGAKVAVYDPNENALLKITTYLEQAWKDLATLTQGLSELPWENLTLTQNLKLACQDADWVQENSPDRLEIKHKLLSDLEDVLAKDIPIASSTTALMASDIQAHMTHPERFLVGHPFNPPHLIPLVEVVAGKKTDPDLPQRAKAFYESFGKEVVIPKREATGHIANRLNAALYREVVYMVATGIATVEDIDRAMVHGPGLRWAFLGPNLVYHLGGGDGGYPHYLDHLGPSQEARWKDLGEAELNGETKEKLIKGLMETLGDTSMSKLKDKRDAALIGLLKLKKDLERPPT